MAGRFGDAGWDNVERHMRLNFEAPVKLTEALLPLLRGPPPAGSGDRAGRDRQRRQHRGPRGAAGAGAYSASKFALVGWSDALHAEEAAPGSTSDSCCPGFVATEGFPAAELAQSRPPVDRGQAGTVAEAIVDAGPGGKAERYTPRPYCLAAAARMLAPALVRRATRGGAFTTATGTNRAPTSASAALRHQASTGVNYR